jgi:DNA-binding transcriptional MerR regulator/quercetin dioxygenase-like cupin family protein
MAELGIGDAAQLTGTNPSTLRLWEQHGLLSPARTASGQRIYRADDIRVIRAIHRMRKEDGLNMSAIKRAFASSQPRAASAAARAGDKSDSALTLGRQFRLARQKQKISLQEAARLTGLPVSFISTFERTGQGATVTSLQKLAATYNTTITELSEPSPRVGGNLPHVVRNNKARLAPQFGTGIRIFQLAETLDSLDCQQWVLQPGAKSDGAYSHEGEEFIHVMQGEFHIAVDGGRVSQLTAGDSISFNSRLAHAWHAAGDEPTILLWINTPKSF